MIFYKKPILLNDNIANEELKDIIKIFRNGNFKEANKKLKLVNKDSIKSKEDKEEYIKLETMLKIDKAGVFAVLFLLTIIIFLFIDFIGK